MRTRTHLASLILGMVLAYVVGSAGQAQRPPATLDDVLNELRGLRTDVVQSLGASGRMQTLIARLSLQEQRVNAVVRDYTSLGSELEKLLEVRAGLEQDITDMETGLRDNSLADELRKAFGQQLQVSKAELAALPAKELELRSRVSDASNLVALEQGRWTEFNSRLDDLERSLPGSR